MSELWQGQNTGTERWGKMSNCFSVHCSWTTLLVWRSPSFDHLVMDVFTSRRLTFIARLWQEKNRSTHRKPVPVPLYLQQTHYLKNLFVPHTKHTSPLKKGPLVKAVQGNKRCSQIHTNHRTTFCGHNVLFLTAKTGDTQKHHSTLKGKIGGQIIQILRI
jgi:hypothetical protein